MYAEDDFLMLSGLQHFVYCRRQWALIHVEQQWQDNIKTITGELFHKTAHDDSKVEKRGDTIITRGLRIQSAVLGVSGICDVVEFHKDANGITLGGYDGLWIPYPIEYKSGAPKEHNADELQLCGEAMCLEAMLACRINEGSLFYGETKRRVKVEFTEDMRNCVKNALQEMHQLYQRGYTPKVKTNKGCRLCSLKEVCLPELEKKESVKDYIEGRMACENY